ncbi:tetratricopeptide repeat protein [Qingshengfaniella alkalisoli]|uniref:Tetratricopeptide repeat protein n=2 Tax=Qingshengfaniella alkalisoli TaxID=2599296 RepID=A0A5B8IWY4_9RHOB|nr:tetratricopeptide repeat protein [Qingshengfaniella alkalisoli]
MAMCAATATSAFAFGNSGSYLAARHAGFTGDFEKAAQYFAQALTLDSGNPDLLENTVGSNVSLGRIDDAYPVAERMLGAGFNSQVSEMVVVARHAHLGEFQEILAKLDEGKSIGPLLDGLLRAWALLGSGDATAALVAFDDVSTQQGLESFGLYHKALALASVGDFEGADTILSGRGGTTLNVTRRGVATHVQVLSQLDREEEAIELIRAAFGSTPAPYFERLLARLDAGEKIAYDIATTPTEGIAEVFFGVSGALISEAPATYTLLYSRFAEYLNPKHIDAVLLSASFLEELEQYGLATEAYNKVPPDNPEFVVAETGRAEALIASDKPDAAIEVLTQLAKTNPDLLLAQVTLADTLRRLDRFEEAAPVYDRAIEMIGTPEPQHWIVYFSRGIVRERTDRWDESEADLRKALELNPDQPQVLNYLGYSLVEEHTDLDEALEMIEKAVEARPEDGYIIDSLGWAQFRLGRYEEAVTHLEDAVQYESIDPIINDHLGDAYWAVGRKLEAQFQWRRALSFDPEEEEADRIRRKLEVGLDKVLEEEGAKPIAVAREG